MIELRSIDFTYSSRHNNCSHEVFRELNLKIQEGEIAGLIGHNGSGKSTLVKLLTGELTPAKGKILIGSEDVTNQPAIKRAAYIGHIFQDSMVGTVPTMTVAENLIFAYGKNKKRSFLRSKFSATALKNLDILRELYMGLENKLNTYASELSGGQRQALSLVMAVMTPCKLLILDEFTSALDIRAQEAITQATLRLIRRHNLTAILISHDMEQVINFSDNIYAIRNSTVSKLEDKNVDTVSKHFKG